MFLVLQFWFLWLSFYHPLILLYGSNESLIDAHLDFLGVGALSFSLLLFPQLVHVVDLGAGVPRVNLASKVHLQLKQ
jgi:hypothetical protein